MLQDTSEVLPHSGGEWNCVVYHPEDPVEINWLAAASAGGGTYGNEYLGFINVSSTAQTFEFECCAVFEAKGTNVHGLKANLADATGFGDVMNMIASPDHLKPYNEDRSDWWKGLGSAVGTVAGVAGNAYAAYARARNRAPPTNQRIQYGMPVITEID
jgi:hypothetical protein